MRLVEKVGEVKRERWMIVNGREMQKKGEGIAK